ncbi:MAG: histidine--tRNA ligase [Bdellovibrionota bacterium]|nr:histidine--tRNA ligase [Bdellovibrionota bacterium]
MSTIKPQNAKGTRDFGPQQMKRIDYIFETIAKNFEAYGFMKIATPAVEKLDVLTGKYGDEGDQLLFKILNNGDFLKKVKSEEVENKDLKSVTKKVSERGLRYDLTVPFARFVSANQNDLAFPFKRYQIASVWRADRPQKGRYREFFQCDADIIGSKSIMDEVSLMEIFDKSFKDLGLKGLSIKVNNRKVLQALANQMNAGDRIVELTVAIDKLDKIGPEKVLEELSQKGFNKDQLNYLSPLFELGDKKFTNHDKYEKLKNIFSHEPLGMQGIEELETLEKLCQATGIEIIDFDPTLARGLDYYTGCIFEVKPDDGSMGSIGSGGRYDDLTNVFGLKDMSGVGISFGADRVYDLMLERGLFENIDNSLDYMIINFSDDHRVNYLELANKLRDKGHTVEVYPSSAKMKKQMNYANKRLVKNVIFLGEDEIKKGMYTVKRMSDGAQTEHLNE